MTRRVSVFLPCRKGSKRVRHKNIRRFGSYSLGLIELKLEQLQECKSIECIYVSTDDERILDYASSLHSSQIVCHQRDDYLCTDTVKLEEVICHAANLVQEGEVLWTHVSSPFFRSNDYEEAIHDYFEARERGYDSLMTTTCIQGYVWSEDSPVNYSRLINKWPPTQTIKPLYEVNNACFIASHEIYAGQKDRIGLRPYLKQVSPFIGFDIDTPADFKWAEDIQHAMLR